MVNLRLASICLLVCVVAGTSTSGSTSKSTTPTTKHTTAIKSTVSTPSSTTESIKEQCHKNNGSCKDCVSNSKCLYCKSDDSCTPYPVGDVIPRSGCDLSDARWGVCWVNFEALLIAVGVIGGVVLIAFGVCIYCCCCRSKGKRYEKDDSKFEQQKMERKVKQDERRNERRGRLDEIRRKYGLVKEDTPYNRFDA